MGKRCTLHLKTINQRLFPPVFVFFPFHAKFKSFSSRGWAVTDLLPFRNRQHWLWQSKPRRLRAKEGNVQWCIFSLSSPFFYCIFFFHLIVITSLLDVLVFCLLQLVIWWPILQGRERGRQLCGMRLFPLIHLHSPCRVCLTCVLQRGLLCLRIYLHLRYRPRAVALTGQMYIWSWRLFFLIFAGFALAIMSHVLCSRFPMFAAKLLTHMMLSCLGTQVSLSSWQDWSTVELIWHCTYGFLVNLVEKIDFYSFGGEILWKCAKKKRRYNYTHSFRLLPAPLAALWTFPRCVSWKCAQSQTHISACCRCAQLAGLRVLTT